MTDNDFNPVVEIQAEVQVTPTLELQAEVDMGSLASERNAEAWAVGQRGGVDVSSTDQTYHNNAKYWAEQAEQTVVGSIIDDTSTALNKTWSAHKISELGGEVSDLKSALAYPQEKIESYGARAMSIAQNNSAQILLFNAVLKAGKSYKVYVEFTSIESGDSIYVYAKDGNDSTMWQGGASSVGCSSSSLSFTRSLAVQQSDKSIRIYAVARRAGVLKEAYLVPEDLGEFVTAEYFRQSSVNIFPYDQSSFEYGGLDSSTGNTKTQDRSIRTKDYINVSDTSLFCIYGDTGFSVYCYCYTDSAYLSYITLSNNANNALPTGTTRVKFIIYNGSKYNINNRLSDYIPNGILVAEKSKYSSFVNKRVLNDTLIDDDSIGTPKIKQEVYEKAMSEARLIHSFAPYQGRGSITSKTSERSFKVNSTYYSAGSLVYTVNGNAYCGLQMNLYENDFNVGDVITVRAIRTGATWVNKIRIDQYDSNNQRVVPEVNSQSDIHQVLIVNGTKRIEITLFACWGIALESGTQVTFSNVEVYTEQVFGYSGNTLYTGEPIVLTNNYQKPNKCNIALWKDFVGTEIPSLADYNLYKNQSIAIFGDYLFMLQEGGTGIVLSMTDKSIISTFTMLPQTYQHNNSAQFTDWYYQAGDEFPLLLSSRCSGTIDGVNYDECQVYRITRSDTAFTFTLINTIKSDIQSMGSSWAIDTANRRIVEVWSDKLFNEHPKVTFDTWEMPSLSDVLSGTPITLSRSNILSTMFIDDFILQGIAVNGGVVYAGRSITSVGQYICGFDLFRNRMINTIHLSDNKEVEGVYIYNKKIYVSQKNGVDTAGTNPAKIYEISFDVG